MKGKAITCLVVIILGMAAFLPPGAAADLVQNISAQINQNVTILWDGKVFVPTDASGNVVQPIIYENRVYVPLRSFGVETGRAVAWDPDTKTITVTTPETPAETPETSTNNENSDNTEVITPSIVPISLIEDLPPYSSSQNLQYGSTAINGEQHANCLYSDTSIGCTASWHLDKKYSKISFSFGNLDQYKKCDGIRITDADTNLTLYWSPKLDPEYSMHNEIDVSSVSNLQIYVSGYTASWDLMAIPVTSTIE